LDRRPRYPFALSRTRFLRSRLAGALVALGIHFHPTAAGPSSTGSCFISLSSDLTCCVSPSEAGQEENNEPFLIIRQIFLYPRFVSFVRYLSLCELALALRIFRLQQVAASGVITQHLSGRSHFKAFSDRFPGFASRNRFWHREPGMYLRGMDWQPEFLDIRASVGFCGLRHGHLKDEAALVQSG
jgi:hypothetical protein